MCSPHHRHFIDACWEDVHIHCFDTEEDGGATIIGAGDCPSAVNKSGLADTMSLISTAGRATLELLERTVLSGVAAPDDVAELLAAAFCGRRVIAAGSSPMLLYTTKYKT